MTSEELDEARDIIFETDEFIFMEILDKIAAEYYGAKNLAKMWRSYREGKLFFLIDKKYQGDSIYIHIPRPSTIEIETFDGEGLNLYDLFKRNPSVEKYIMDNVNPLDMGTYFALKAVASGMEPQNMWVMEQVDDLISQFKFIKGNPKNSIVTLRFDSVQDYFKTFEVSDETIWAVGVILNDYGSGFEWVDTSDGYQWDEGMLLTYYLNQENKDKINEIMSVLKPELRFVENDEDENQKIVKVLDLYFPEVGNDFVYEYATLENQSRNETARKELKDEFCDIYEKFNIFRKRGCYWEYQTPVWNLIKLYDKFDAHSLTIEELISRIGHSLSVTDYGEYIYEVYGNNFDDDAFNREIARTLDKVIEKLEDLPNKEEVKKVYDEISKKYQFGKWYSIPTMKDGNFMIDGINTENAKLIVRFLNMKGFPSKTEVSLEDFRNLLTNYSLF